MVQHTQALSVVQHISRIMNKKDHMILSIYTEKAFDKIQYLFMIRALKKLEIEGTYQPGTGGSCL
jgi:hypothetical protein